MANCKKLVMSQPAHFQLEVCKWCSTPEQPQGVGIETAVVRKIIASLSLDRTEVRLLAWEWCISILVSGLAWQQECTC